MTDTPSPAVAMLDTARDPFDLFRSWFKDAEGVEVNDPNAMTVATVDAAGRPSARILLLKEMDDRGFVFYTNTKSRKGGELDGQKVAALLFHWKSLRRQVRIEGPVERVTDAEADAYFATRPRGSRIGAWASLQSQPLDSRETLEKRVVEIEAMYAGRDVPRPPHWSGYRLVPDHIEFWQDREFRLHDRITFRRGGDSADWTITRLYP